MYKAWIKELNNLVYDNSKSEYQILSELIPILLDLKDNQDKFSEDMDTFYNSLNEKISSLLEVISNARTSITASINSFSETFNENISNALLEFSSIQETNTKQISDLISRLQENYNNEKDVINNLLNIDTLLDNINTSYQDILNKINTYVSNAYNSDRTKEYQYGALENKYANEFLSNRTPIYINLVAYQDTAPASANDNEIYYNTSNKKLYKWLNSSWNETTIRPNALYKFNNKLYYGSVTLEQGDLIHQFKNSIFKCYGFLNENIIWGLYDSVAGREKIATYNIITQEENIYDNLVFPSDFRDFRKNDTNFIILYNNIYYAIYLTNNSTALMKSTDLINWEKIDNVSFSNNGAFLIINNNLVLNTEENSYIISDSVTNASYKVIGYLNNKYYAIFNYTEIKTSATIDFTESELFFTLTSNDVKLLSFFQGIEYNVIGNALFNKNLEYLNYQENRDITRIMLNDYLFMGQESTYSSINGSDVLFYPLGNIYPEKFNFNFNLIYDTLSNKIYQTSNSVFPSNYLYNVNIISELLEVPTNAS